MEIRKDKVKELKQKLLKCGFIIDKNKRRNITMDISKKNRPKLKEKLRKILDEV